MHPQFNSAPLHSCLVQRLQQPPAAERMALLGSLIPRRDDHQQRRIIAQRVNCLVPSRILPLLCISMPFYSHTHVSMSLTYPPLDFATVSASNLMAEVSQPHARKASLSGRSINYLPIRSACDLIHFSNAVVSSEFYLLLRQTHRADFFLQKQEESKT
jgi:hypothetical protein